MPGQAVSRPRETTGEARYGVGIPTGETQQSSIAHGTAPLPGEMPTIPAAPQTVVTAWTSVALLLGVLAIAVRVWIKPGLLRLARRPARALLVGALLAAACLLLLLWTVESAHAAQTVPLTRWYQGHLLDNSGTAVTTEVTIRFSEWKSADFTASDLTATGSINTGAAHYLSWSEEHTLTPSTDGSFAVELGSINALPDFTGLPPATLQSMYLQVEVKTSGAADSTYDLLDTNTSSTTVDRTSILSLPFARNADLLDQRDTGTASGSIPVLTTGGALSLDGDLTLNADSGAANAVLTFGNNILNETLQFNVTTSRFEFSDDVGISGDLEVTGTMSGALITQNGTGDNYFLGNVGVGTANVETTLDVAGSPGGATPTAQIQHTWSNQNPGSINVLELVRSGTPGLSYNNYVDFALSRFESVGTTARTQLDINLQHGDGDGTDTSVMTLRSNGNVGIGTTAPENKLEVVGSMSGRTLQVTGTGAAPLITTVGGNVGIGTATPGTTLDVNGTSNFSNTMTITNNNTSGNYVSPLTINNINTNTAGLYVLTSGANINGGGGGSIESYLNTNTYDATFTGFGISNGAYNSPGYGSNILFRKHTGYRMAQQAAITSGWTDASDATRKGYIGLNAYDATASREGLRITTDGTNALSTFTGNVGIGTTTPDVKLSVAGTASGKVLSFGDRLTGSGSVSIRTLTDSTTAFQVLDSDGGTPVFNIDTTNERVGIGTASPGTPLDVVGLIETVGSTGGIQFAPRDGGGSYEQIYNGTGEGLDFFVGGSEKFTILDSGNVGIGTTAPETTLEVTGTLSGHTLHAEQSLTASGKLVTDGQVQMNSGATIGYTGNTASFSSGGLLQFTGGAGVSLPYGSFSDSTTQTMTGTTMAYKVKFDTDEFKSGITHSTTTNTSRVYVDQAGTYLITFSAIGKSAAPNKIMDIWLAVDGVNVPRSNTVSKFVGSANERIITVTYLYKFKANQYFELLWNSDDAGTTIAATAAGTNPTRPASPSIIMTVNMISKD